MSDWRKNTEIKWLEPSCCRCKEPVLEKRPGDNGKSCVESIQARNEDKGQDHKQSRALNALQVRGLDGQKVSTITHKSCDDYVNWLEKISCDPTQLDFPRAVIQSLWEKNYISLSCYTFVYFYISRNS